MAKRYWLLKSDPETFSFEDLRRSPKGTTRWDGVRNYQARNSLRDDVRKGDGVLFYHSQPDKAVVGTAVVTAAGYPDPTQFDRKHPGYDPGATVADPRWFAVDIAVDRVFSHPVNLDALRATPGLGEMVLLRTGSRLSVQPVTAAEWRIVTRLGGA